MFDNSKRQQHGSLKRIKRIKKKLQKLVANKRIRKNFKFHLKMIYIFIYLLFI